MLNLISIHCKSDKKIKLTPLRPITRPGGPGGPGGPLNTGKPFYIIRFKDIKLNEASCHIEEKKTHRGTTRISLVPFPSSYSSPALREI